MTGDEFAEQRRRLEQLRGRASSAALVMRQVAALRPEGGQGADPSRAIRVATGGDGLPVQVWVAADWQDRVPPAGLGGAVVAACRAAAAERLDTWADHLDRENALPLRARTVAPPLDVGRSEGRGAGDDVAAPPAPSVPTPAVPPGLVQAVLREHLDATIQAPRAVAPDAVIGQAAGGRLSVTVDAGGLRGCSADPAWAAGQSAARITMALNDAVADARTRMATAHTVWPGAGDVGDVGGVGDLGAGLGRLGADALAALRRVAAGAQTPGGRFRDDGPGAGAGVGGGW